jgi:hypothetical protein
VETVEDSVCGLVADTETALDPVVGVQQHPVGAIAARFPVLSSGRAR